MRASLLLVASLAFAAPAAAAKDKLAQAKSHFAEGARRFAAGDFLVALDEFTESHELSGRTELLFNIARCHDRLGNFEEALGNLERYLAERPDAPNRQSVEDWMQDLRQRKAAHSPAVAQPDWNAPPPEPASEETPAVAVDEAEEEEPRPWYRNPWVWGAGGAVVIGVVVAGVALSGGGGGGGESAYRGDYADVPLR